MDSGLFPCSGYNVADAAAAPTATKITLHVDQTSISFPLKPESGRELQAGLQILLQTFAEKQKAERPQRWKSMEFKLKGEAGQNQWRFQEGKWHTGLKGGEEPSNPGFDVAGQPGEGDIQFLEVFCNPNASTTAFDAKALITIKTADGLQLTTEGRLSALKADLDLFLEQT